jgi:hypothetical protein
MTDHLIVAIIAIISGRFAIPIGFLLDLPPIETYLAASAGALVGMGVFVFVGTGLRGWVVPRLNISEEKLEGAIAASVGLRRRQITRDEVTELFVVPHAEQGNVP